MSTQHSGINDSHPSQYENAVFVSYKWGGEGEEIVNQIEQALQARGIRLIRDKRDLGFKGPIRKFMERMGRGNCVIVVINDGYLRSKHCMFELMEIAEAEQFHDRVFPVVLGDADIYDPVKIIGYVKHWEEKQTELTEAMKSVDQANLQGIRDEIDLYDRIRDEISGLISTLNDMNTLTPEIHKEGDYSILAKAIEESIGAKDSVQQETIQDRRLDAAMPKECQVGHTTEVRVLIALPDSQGLKAHLPDYTISRELIARADVEEAALPIKFPYDQTTGQPLSVHLYVEIAAPGFQIRQRVQQILVPPGRDSGMLTFFLTPRSTKPIGRVSAKLYQDEDCAIALGSVTLSTTVSSQMVQGIAGSWYLAMLPLDPSAFINSVSSELVETLIDSPPDHTMDARQRLRRNLSNLSPVVLVSLFVGIIGAAATIIAALIQITPAVVDFFNSTRVIASSPPACITQDDILVRLHVSKGQQLIATLVPSGRITLEPDVTVDLQVDFKSVSDQPVPTLTCAWDNANSENITSPTEGKLLHTAGCTVDYQSGHNKITDTISLQVSQESCPGLLSYAFFVFPQ